MVERDIDIYRDPNPALVSFLATSQPLRRELLETALKVASLYMANLPSSSKYPRTGRLKAGTRVSLSWNELTNDRPQAEVQNNTYYAVWNLTGAGPGMHTHSTGKRPRYGPFKGDYTFREALKVFGS